MHNRLPAHLGMRLHRGLLLSLGVPRQALQLRYSWRVAHDSLRIALLPWHSQRDLPCTHIDRLLSC